MSTDSDSVYEDDVYPDDSSVDASSDSSDSETEALIDRILEFDEDAGIFSDVPDSKIQKTGSLVHQAILLAQLDKLTQDLQAASLLHTPVLSTAGALKMEALQKFWTGRPDTIMVFEESGELVGASLINAAREPSLRTWVPWLVYCVLVPAVVSVADVDVAVVVGMQDGIAHELLAGSEPLKMAGPQLKMCLNNFVTLEKKIHKARGTMVHPILAWLDKMVREASL